MATKKKTKRTWQPTIGAKLGPQEQRLRDWLGRAPGIVSDVETLFRIATKTVTSVRRMPELRTMQQRVGAIAARHNRKVKSPHIVRGDTPGTYRLKRVR